jgi:ArsR family transcriptional regulator
MNMSQKISPEVQIAGLFQLLGQPVRMQILLVLAKDEACVCHLEAALGLRQAVISQHLMVLRKAGLVEIRRSGRHIFYTLSQVWTTDLLFQAAKSIGIPVDCLEAVAIRPVTGCPCPQCSPGTVPCKGK